MRKHFILFYVFVWIAIDISGQTNEQQILLDFPLLDIVPIYMNVYVGESRTSAVCRNNQYSQTGILCWCNINVPIDSIRIAPENIKPVLDKYNNKLDPDHDFLEIHPKEKIPWIVFLTDWTLEVKPYPEIKLAFDKCSLTDSVSPSAFTYYFPHISNNFKCRINWNLKDPFSKYNIALTPPDLAKTDFVEEIAKKSANEMEEFKTTHNIFNEIRKEHFIEMLIDKAEIKRIEYKMVSNKP